MTPVKKPVKIPLKVLFDVVNMTRVSRPVDTATQLTEKTQTHTTRPNVNTFEEDLVCSSNRWPANGSQLLHRVLQSADPTDGYTVDHNDSTVRIPCIINTFQ